MKTAEWTKGIKVQDLPKDLQLVAQECGIDVALKLVQQLGGVQLYICKMDALLFNAKRRYVFDKFSGANHTELALATGMTERWVYDILAEDRDARQTGLFPVEKPPHL